ncbi:hypothetical protein C8J57DRAFT_1223091 [Mycena rebaudengoi]|nr:hypothetical protein C8J57DRAFT_1223091 [Mycena rebaudengoi]
MARLQFPQEREVYHSISLHLYPTDKKVLCPIMNSELFVLYPPSFMPPLSTFPYPSCSKILTETTSMISRTSQRRRPNTAGPSHYLAFLEEPVSSPLPQLIYFRFAARSVNARHVRRNALQLAAGDPGEYEGIRQLKDKILDFLGAALTTESVNEGLRARRMRRTAESPTPNLQKSAAPGARGLTRGELATQRDSTERSAGPPTRQTAPNSPHQRAAAVQHAEPTDSQPSQSREDEGASALKARGSLCCGVAACAPASSMRMWCLAGSKHMLVLATASLPAANIPRSQNSTQFTFDPPAISRHVWRKRSTQQRVGNPLKGGGRGREVGWTLSKRGIYLEEIHRSGHHRRGGAAVAHQPQDSAWKRQAFPAGMDKRLAGRRHASTVPLPSRRRRGLAIRSNDGIDGRTLVRLGGSVYVNADIRLDKDMDELPWDRRQEVEQLMRAEREAPRRSARLNNKLKYRSSWEPNKNNSGSSGIYDASTTEILTRGMEIVDSSEGKTKERIEVEGTSEEVQNCVNTPTTIIGIRAVTGAVYKARIVSTISSRIDGLSFRTACIVCAVF